MNAAVDVLLQADPPPVDPAEVAGRVERIMSEPGFDYGPSWFDRLSDWIAKQLERLFGGAEPGAPVQGGQFAGGIGSLVAWGIIIAAVIAVLAVVIYVVRNRVRRDREDDTPPTETEIEHRRAAAAWRSDAERFEQEGEWKLALRARYRELVRTLTDRRQLPDVAGRTTGELRDDLDATTPAAREPFDTACLLFELAWYADVPTGEDEQATFRSAAARILDAPVEHTTDERHDGGGRGRGERDDRGSSLEVIG